MSCGDLPSCRENTDRAAKFTILMTIGKLPVSLASISTREVPVQKQDIVHIWEGIRAELAKGKTFTLAEQIAFRSIHALRPKPQDGLSVDVTRIRKTLCISMATLHQFILARDSRHDTEKDIFRCFDASSTFSKSESATTTLSLIPSFYPSISLFLLSHPPTPVLLFAFVSYCAQSPPAFALLATSNHLNSSTSQCHQLTPLVKVNMVNNWPQIPMSLGTIPREVATMSSSMPTQSSRATKSSETMP